MKKDGEDNFRWQGELNGCRGEHQVETKTQYICSPLHSFQMKTKKCDT